MVHIMARSLTIKGKQEPITSFEVWFQTPWGLMDTLDDAVQRCIANDMDPDTMIVPVSVAISESSYEVVGR